MDVRKEERRESVFVWSAGLFYWENNNRPYRVLKILN